MARGDSLDVLVMDVAVSYQNRRNKEQERKQALKSGQLPDAPDIPLNTLQEMLNRVKGNEV